MPGRKPAVQEGVAKRKRGRPPNAKSRRKMLYDAIKERHATISSGVVNLITERNGEEVVEVNDAIEDASLSTICNEALALSLGKVFIGVQHPSNERIFDTDISIEQLIEDLKDKPSDVQAITELLKDDLNRPMYLIPAIRFNVSWPLPNDIIRSEGEDMIVFSSIVLQSFTIDKRRDVAIMNFPNYSCNAFKTPLSIFNSFVDFMITSNQFSMAPGTDTWITSGIKDHLRTYKVSKMSTNVKLDTKNIWTDIHFTTLNNASKVKQPKSPSIIRPICVLYDEMLRNIGLTRDEMLQQKQPVFSLWHIVSFFAYATRL